MTFDFGLIFCVLAFIWTEQDNLSQMATILSIPLGLKSASLEIM